VVHVLKSVTARGLVAWRARACIANADHEDLRPHRLEMVEVLEVALEGIHELLLDVEHSSAYLAHGVVVVTAGELVVSRTLAQVCGVNRP
jgi:hypothetical protein